MKIILHLMVGLFLVQTCVWAEDGTVKYCLIGLSPYYTVAERHQIERKIRDFVLSAPKGSTIKCEDAYNLQTIAVFSVPDSKFDSSAGRMREIAPSLVALSQWFKKSASNSLPELQESRALKTPQWLDQVTAQAEAQFRSVILVGSPLYRSIEEPGFNMLPDLYPSDAHLSAAPDISVFSVSRKRSQLANTCIHWAYPSESIWANQLHADRVKRFWYLWTAGQKGCLGTFGPDLSSVFASATRRSFPSVANYSPNEDDGKVTMAVARPREIPRWMAPSTSTNSLDVNANSLKSEPSPKTPASAPSANQIQPPLSTTLVLPNREARPVVLAIGLKWNSNVDVDLYVRIPGQSRELSFMNVLNSSGRYLHDFRAANQNYDYEWTEIWDPTIRPEAVDVWANFYSGSGTAQGTVCVFFQGKQYVAEFSLAANQGNGGRDANHRENSAYWTRLDLKKILAQAR